jgi:hypothetical protein
VQRYWQSNDLDRRSARTIPGQRLKRFILS